MRILSIFGKRPKLPTGASPIVYFYMYEEEDSRNKSKFYTYYDKSKPLIYQKKWKKAEKVLSKAVASFEPVNDAPHDKLLVLASRSTALYHLQRLEEALVDAECVIAGRPDWSVGYLRKADVLFEKDSEEALTFYEKAFDLEMDSKLRSYINQKVVQIVQRREADSTQLYFVQLRPGIEVCYKTYNPLKRLIFEFARGMKNLMYLIGDLRARECLIVDACWDADGIIKILERDHMLPVGAIVTHNHFDHVGGKPPRPFSSYGISVQGLKTILKRYPKIPVYVHRDDADLLQSETGIDPERINAIEDLYEIKVGEVPVQFIWTPGHTPGSQCILFNGNRLLTGDTLFKGTCGRFDLPGGSREMLFDSLQNKLRLLPDTVVVYPGHSYNDSYLSTIGMEKSDGPLRQMTYDEWSQNNNNNCIHRHY